jgi:hypothetical protein
MYKTVAACIFLVAGCAANGLPIDSSGGGGASGGGGGGGGGGTGVIVDMAWADLTNIGRYCLTACDCEPGIACIQHACEKSPLGPLYCCEGICPPDNFCQHATGGGFGVCPGSGSFDFGLPDLRPLCLDIQCSDNRICQQWGCGLCNGKTCQ